MSWRAESERPRFGRRGRAWLRALLRQELNQRVIAAGAVPLSEELLPHAVERYVHAAEGYVQWRAPAEYRGPGYSAGAYSVRWDLVLADWAAIAIAVIEDHLRARDAERFPSLDAWLEADRQGKLESRGAPEPSVRELLGTAPRRLKGRRACSDCGEDFIPRPRGRGLERTCGPCQVRQKRERWEARRRNEEAARRRVAEAEARRVAEAKAGQAWGLADSLEQVERKIAELGQLFADERMRFLRNPPEET